MMQYAVPGSQPARGGPGSPARRSSWYTGVLVLLFFLVPSTASRAQDSDDPQVEPIDEERYERWLAGLIGEARERGISESLIENVLEPVRPIPRVISNDRSQAEFVETLEEYLERRVTDWRINTGRQRMAEHAGLLQRITREYGVPGRYIVAIWGIETNYGNLTGGTDVILALVTLAFDPRRADYFRSELFAALRILEEGHVAPGRQPAEGQCHACQMDQGPDQAGPARRVLAGHRGRRARLRTRRARLRPLQRPAG